MHVLSALVAAVSLLTQPATVLHQWDARREAAWASSDEQALRSLYVPGSVAGRRDVRLLRAYDARGLVVRRIVTQVLELQTLEASSRGVRIRVVDRVAGGVVDDRQLGTTAPAAHVIEFRRVGTAWRVVSVTETGPRSARPARPGR